ncbi:hypothetical protein DdX_11496 [Ditylenchus destructor]|uniref:Uncharacterized protein n=1 Tax=Ditylenchus destructor TaxID=166010 RepID=A0AAD4R4B1_9BILA|nr:hypothetical protein DdX_11496 [Ditylenchus destructor]
MEVDDDTVYHPMTNEEAQRFREMLDEQLVDVIQVKSKKSFEESKRYRCRPYKMSLDDDVVFRPVTNDEADKFQEKLEQRMANNPVMAEVKQRRRSEELRVKTSKLHQRRLSVLGPEHLPQIYGYGGDSDDDNTDVKPNKDSDDHEIGETNTESAPNLSNELASEPDINLLPDVTPPKAQEVSQEMSNLSIQPTKRKHHEEELAGSQGEPKRKSSISRVEKQSSLTPPDEGLAQDGPKRRNSTSLSTKHATAAPLDQETAETQDDPKRRNSISRSRKHSLAAPLDEQPVESLGGPKRRNSISRSKKNSTAEPHDDESTETQAGPKRRSSISRTMKPSTLSASDSTMLLKAPKIVTAPSDSSGGRPQRNRMKPLKFWANQTVVYKYDENKLPEASGVSEVKIDGRRRSAYSSFTKYKPVENDQ